LTEDTSTVLTKENVDKYRDLVSASLFKRHFERAPQDIKEMLWIQYRMHPQIMRLVNYFYDNRLQCGLSNPDQQRAHDLTLKNDRGLSYISPQDHAVWIDSSKDHNGIEYFEGQSGSSKINLLEVKMIGQLLLDINTQQAAKRRSIDVGVISFYGHQVREIRKEIRRLQSQKKLTHIKVSTDTVDRFQGKENSIILVSLVRNQRSAQSRRNKHVTQFERINVALSRAQKLLVVVGAKNFFADVLVNMPEIEGDIISEQRTYQHMIAQMNTDGRFKTSRELLPQNCVIPSSGVRTGSVWDELNVGDLTSVQVATIKENGIEVTFTEIDSQARGFIHQRQLQKKDVNRYTEGDVLQGEIHKMERPSKKKRRGSILINEVRNG
jgi:superfamily I DNA and/or RNA helicase